MKTFVKLYILFGYYYQKLFARNLRGIGFVQKLLNKDTVLKFKKKKIYYNHLVEGSYDMLFIGKSNEPETHRFFERVSPHLGESTP
jgi:hypothetical protein